LQELTALLLDPSVTSSQGALHLSDHLDASQPEVTTSSSAAVGLDRNAAVRILARSFYKELRENGYTPKQLLALSTELIELVTEDLAREREAKAQT
jgi:hypothetical protein